MKATKLLKQQHDEISDLFDKIERAQRDRKVELFEQLAAHLVGHDAIEREIFYPACEEQLGKVDLLGESLVEHGIIEFSLFRADQNVGTDAFDHYMYVVREMVDHHVAKEEEDFFPDVEGTFSSDRLEELGAEMEQRFEESIASDFRPMLLSSLREAMGGALEAAPVVELEIIEEKAPKPAKTRAPTKRAASAKARARTHH
ncbi:MAG: hypothetical protein HOW73_29375 [Polyangiaceae bacterium]|nr:hypothetical protein [Polyangiaceae bacterium]